jgi:signal transduction histidine kinase
VLALILRSRYAGQNATMSLRRLWPVAAATAVCAAAWVALGLTDGLTFVLYLAGLVPLGLGWLIAVRAPASPVGAAVAWLAAFIVATPGVEAWGSGPVVGAAVWPWQLVGFMWLLLVFPDGLPAGRLWRAVAALVPVSALGVTVAFVLTVNYHDDPVGHSPVSVPEPVWFPLMVAALGFLLAIVVSCATSVVLRYRRGDHRVRQQLRWLILAAGTVVVLMVASWVVTALGWVGESAYAGFLLGIVVLVPAAVAVAVLRHDLFEIDRILSDSVAWLLTTAVAGLALAALVVGVGYLVGRDSAAGLTGSVFVVALMLLPLHRRIHRTVGRVIDRDRTVILEQIQRFVDQVRDGSAEPESVERVLRTAVGDPRLALLLTDVDSGGYVDLSGAAAEVPDGTLVPLRTADADIAVVALSNGAMRQVRRAKLAASAARLPIEVSRLRLGLRRAVTEVADSRRRLVSAAAEERRRLERDLHDGAQQKLVAVGMQLRAAQRRLPAGHPAAGELDQAVDRLEQTVAELRRLAHGVRPISLDDGLPAALSRLNAGCPIPIEFTVEDTAASELVTTTAYFVVAEALANVLKHAKATRVEVTVRRAGEQLHVSVADNGIGGAAFTGLTALRDRVGSIGGTLAVTSAPHTGTTIAAVLPMSEPASSAHARGGGSERHARRPRCAS